MSVHLVLFCLEWPILCLPKYWPFLLGHSEHTHTHTHTHLNAHTHIGCNWKVRTIFGYELHMPKQEENVRINICPETFNLWDIAESVLSWHQWQFSISMWPGIVGDCLQGPHVLPHWLTGNHYWDFLLYDLPKLLGDVPLVVRTRMWYMHDGAPAHFSCAVRDVLTNTYHDR
jgi:hypothetical protein